MRILSDLENERISVEPMGINKVLGVIILLVILEVLGRIPEQILNIFSKQIGTPILYMNCIIEAVVKCYIIHILLKIYRSDLQREPSETNINKKNFIYAGLMIIGFRMFFHSSLLYLLNKIPMAEHTIKCFEELYSLPFIIIVIKTIVIAPIYEEVIFRGIILNGMFKKYNAAVAIVLSSLLFAIAHMNIHQGINAFFIGLIIGFVYLRTGSIYLSIFIHCVNNTIAKLPSGLVESICGKYTIVINVIIFIIGLICLIISYKWHNKNTTQKCKAITVEN